MTKPLRILHLEDDPLDAELVKSALEDVGMACDISLVVERDDFIAAVADGVFDIILSDYSLPNFNGLSALAIVRERLPYIPFIFVTGKMGEEFAIETLKNGATDYVLKTSLTKLVPSIQRALRETSDQEKLKKASIEMEKVNRALRVLSKCNEAMLHAADYEVFLDQICRIIIEDGKYLMAWIGYPQSDEEKTVLPVAYAGHEDGYLSSIKISWADNKWGQGPTGTATRRGEVCVQNNMLTNPRFAPWEEAAARRGYASSIGLPLMAGGQCFGALTIYAPERDIFVEEERKLLKELADNVAFGITNLEMSNRKRLAEEQLRKSNEELRNLAEHLQSIREEERSNIAREIHDELGQMMAALRMDVAWMKRTYSDHKGILEKTSASLRLIDATIKSIRKICTELRPDILDHLGLEAAIQWQAQEFQNKTGIQCKVAVEDGIKVDDCLSTALFRIFQEALTNVLRHSKATTVKATLNEHENNLLLEVADNGIGISGEQLSKANSFGLLGMRERAHIFNGELRINSSQNKGTTITVLIPRDNGKQYPLFKGLS